MCQFLGLMERSPRFLRLGGTAAAAAQTVSFAERHHVFQNMHMYCTLVPYIALKPRTRATAMKLYNYGLRYCEGHRDLCEWSVKLHNVAKALCILDSIGLTCKRG